MKTKYLILILCFSAAVIAGIALAVIQTLRKNSDGNSDRRKPFGRLLQDSLTIALLDGPACSGWFKEQAAAKAPVRTEGLLTFASEELIHELGYDCPKELDMSHYMLQMLLDPVKTDVLAFRLINFQELHPGLREAMEESGAYRVELS